MVDPFVILAPLLLLAVVGLLRFVGCVGDEPVLAPPADTPDFDPAPNTYVGIQHVAVKSNVTKIRYTTDGTDPRTSQTQQNYKDKIPIATTLTLRAVAGGASGFGLSEVRDGLYTILPALVPPQHLDYAEEGPAAPDSVSTVPFPVAASKGDLMVVWFWYEPGDTGATVQTVADNAGNTYQPAVGPTHYDQATGRPAIYYSKIEHTGVQLQITVTFSAEFPGRKEMSAHLYRGLDPTWQFRKADAKFGNAPDAKCGPVGVALNDLIFAAGLFANSGAKDPAFELRSGSDGNVVEDRIAQPGQMSAEGKFENPSQVWVAQMATFGKPV